MNIIDKIKNSIISSVQAMPNEPLYKEECMNAMIQSVLKGGAKALRLAGARDIKNAKKFTDVPIIGLTKPEVIPKNWKQIVYITSGIINGKEKLVADACGQAGLEVLGIRQQGEWMSVVARKC